MVAVVAVFSQDEQPHHLKPNTFLEESTCLQGYNETEYPLSCQKYQIVTMNSNPHRCLHLKEVQQTEKKRYCRDYPDWTDGTNGCSAYKKEELKGNGWCEKYGNIRKDEFSAKEACCICSGGDDKELRFGVGDVVSVMSNKIDPSCLLKVVKVLDKKLYTFEIIEDCGRHGWNYNTRIREFEAGYQVSVDSDDHRVVQSANNFQFELRRCRQGVKEQEFWITPETDDENLTPNYKFIIKHVLTNTTISLPSADDGPVELERVFNEEKDEFFGSNGFVHILESSKILSYGTFGKAEFSSPKWLSMETETSAKSQPYTMWSLNRVETVDLIDRNDDSNHGTWLKEKTKYGGLDYLNQLPPWLLLDVDRDAPKEEVKARFRQLSKLFHPDKHGGPLFNEVFILLQAAYEGLKNSNTAEKEKFRANAEVQAQLFAHSKHVFELLPSHWTQSGEGAKSKYVLRVANNVTKLCSSDPEIQSVENRNMCDEKGENSTISSSSSGDVQAWLIFLYSPRCGMSRMVPSMIELAAKHLEKENIRIGAYGCGIHGDSLESSKERGFEAWLTDPICKQFGRRETPNTHLMMEFISGDADFMERAQDFRYFYAAAAQGTASELFPRPLINFAETAYRAWEDSMFVKSMDEEDFDHSSFSSSPHIVAFFDKSTSIPVRSEVNDIQDAIHSALPSIARRSADANITVGMVTCGTNSDVGSMEEEKDNKLVDCSKLDVSWLPDIKLYGKNDTTGISLLSDDFGDRRDVQIGKSMSQSRLYQHRAHLPISF
jgi:curved DNA-binding protein CbpA